MIITTTIVISNIIPSILFIMQLCISHSQHHYCTYHLDLFCLILLIIIFVMFSSSFIIMIIFLLQLLRESLRAFCNFSMLAVLPVLLIEADVPHRVEGTELMHPNSQNLEASCLGIGQDQGSYEKWLGRVSNVFGGHGCKTVLLTNSPNEFCFRTQLQNEQNTQGTKVGALREVLIS